MATLTEEETRKTRLHHPKKIGNIDGPLIEIIFKKPVGPAKPGDSWRVPKIEGREPGVIYTVSEDLAHHYTQVLKCATVHAVKDPKAKPEGPGTKTMKRLRKEAANEGEPKPGRGRHRAMDSPRGGRQRGGKDGD
jgi:hypothetical protein